MVPASPTAQTSPVALPQTALRLYPVSALNEVHAEPFQCMRVATVPTVQMSFCADPQTAARGFAWGSGLVQHQPSELHAEAAAAVGVGVGVGLVAVSAAVVPESTTGLGFTIGFELPPPSDPGAVVLRREVEPVPPPLPHAMRPAPRTQARPRRAHRIRISTLSCKA
jgi:hypothetical protein